MVGFFYRDSFRRDKFRRDKFYREDDRLSDKLVQIVRRLKERQGYSDMRPLDAVWSDKRAALGSQSGKGVAAWPRPQGVLAGVAIARLDNRADLYRQLNIDVPTSQEITDIELLLHAYAKWGPRCAERLLGAFALVIWDAEEQRLFLARDHMGLSPLYFYSAEDRFVFAHEPKFILAYPEVPKRLNRRQVAKLAVPASIALDKESTFYEGIFALPAATAMIVTADSMRRWTYWQPDPELRLDIPAREIPEAVRAALFDAVAARLPAQGPAIALLSGGLDSSAIVAVAATILKQQNRNLTTLSAVLPPGSPASAVDERAYIDQFRSWENIDIVYVTDPDRGPFDNIEALVRAGERPTFTSRHYLYSAFAAAATERGASVILDGVGGELGPTFHGDGYYPELLLTGRWWRLGRELVQRAHVDEHPIWRTVASNLVRPLLPAWALRSLGRASVRFDVAQSHANHLLQPAFVAATLGDEVETLLAQLVRAVTPYHNHRRNQARAIGHFQGGAGFGGFIGSDAVQMHYPFKDKRLLELCLAAPGEVKVQAGYKRALVRTALDGLLPSPIQWRLSKEPFDPGYHLRYNRRRPSIARALAEISDADPIRELVDVEKLARLSKLEMSHARGATPQDFAAMHVVTGGMYLVAFLRMFDSFKLKTGHGEREQYFNLSEG